MPKAADPFFEPYDRDQVAYGSVPSSAVQAYLDQVTVPVGCKALDLGAGAGRDSLALARAGFDVTSVDLSQRGLDRIVERAEKSGLGERVNPTVGDVRELDLPVNHYDAIVATTVLDHLPPEDAEAVWSRMVAALAPQGFLFAEVHTTEDPGSDRWPGSARDAPVSETAAAVINYFAPNQLVEWALQAKLRVLRYEERLEWDYTHGPEHLHGKAVLLAVPQGFHPNWFGQPAAFPRRPQR
jgi:cyclopropane fatty-acyl-phospholipid synthase-like methyltransferase